MSETDESDTKEEVVMFERRIPIKGKMLQIVAFAIASIYVWAVLSFQALDISADVPVFLFFLFLPLSIVIVLGIYRIFSRVCDIQLNKVPDVVKEKRQLLRFVGIVFFATAAFFVIYWLGQYPGGMSKDTLKQYIQAVGDAGYSNWHPVLHTLIFFAFPLKLGGNLGMIVLMQLLYFSLAFTYLVYVMAKNGCPFSLLIFVCIFVWINPFLAAYMMYPWKDIAFTIFSVLLWACYIQIICTKGKWFASKINIVLFSVSLVLCTYMRHNAVLFTIPLAIIICCHLNKKKILLIMAAVLLFVGGVEWTYLAVNVEDPDSRMVEMAGLPASVWCKVMQNNPSALSEETREVFYTFATQETYETEFTGSFNSVKWSDNFKKDEINDMTYAEVIDYTAKCLICAPRESLKAVADLTEVVWGLGGKDSPETVSVIENTYGISEKPLPAAQIFVRQIKELFDFRAARIWFGSNGFKLFTIFLLACLLLADGRVSIIHIIPLFCYNFGTMLLLSGRDYRFFLLNIPLWLPVVFIMLKDQRRILVKKG